MVNIVRPLPRRAILLLGIGRRHVFGLVVPAGFSQPVFGRGAQLHQQLIKQHVEPVGVVALAGFLDVGLNVTQRWARQMQGSAGAVDGRGKTAVSGQRPAFGAHDPQHQEIAVIALQARNQPGPQKRRLAATGGA